MAGEKYKDAPAPGLGSLVLVRLSFTDEEGNIVEERQFQGAIEKISDEEVVLRHPSNGAEVSLPPYFGSYERAPKGKYQLKSTGETIVDPDYITEWTLRV